jgi:hypothetical protein
MKLPNRDAVRATSGSSGFEDLALDRDEAHGANAAAEFQDARCVVRRHAGEPPSAGQIVAAESDFGVGGFPEHPPS